MRYKLNIAISILLWTTYIYGQDNNTLPPANHDSITFTTLLKAISDTSNLNFYYQPSWFDTLWVKKPQNNINLNNLLKETLNNQPYTYLIFDTKNIIFAKNYIFISHINDSLYKKEQELFEKPATEKTEHSFFKESEELTNKKGTINIGNPNLLSFGSKGTLIGKITEIDTGEPIIGAVVYSEEYGIGASTDVYGSYTITLPKGKNKLAFKSIGKKEQIISVIINADGRLNIELEEDAVLLKDILVTSEREHNVHGLEVGLESMDIKTIKKLPNTMGEADIIKTALLLPGIQSMGEGASGFNVRGGSTDQNLVLIDNMPLYNSSHLFGFFSSINPDIVNGFDLYKSSFPANYGGRLSSVLDINLKTGNKKVFSVAGGISPITGKILIEGPILKDKASFVLSARSTYSDWILKKINVESVQNSSASFYDFNARFNFDINNNNTLYLSGYHSNDYFKLNSDTTYTYQNLSGSAGWKHFYGAKIYSIFEGIYSRYEYLIESSENPLYGFNLAYNIEHSEGKIGFVYKPNSKHTIKWGVNSILYKIAPGDLTPYSEDSDIIPETLPQDKGVESAIYLDEEFIINPRISFNLGFRYSSFLSMGTGWVYNYASGMPRIINNRIDSTYYDGQSIQQKYAYPEFRFSCRIGLDANSSIKASYGNMTQYIHMLSNTTAISPTDTWALSDKYLKPQLGKQFSLGYYRNFNNNKIETSVETYYKTIHNMPEYKGGADLILNQDLECDLIAGEGKSYGIEFMAEKKSGKLTGWFSYTYARSFITVNGIYPDEKINNGNTYPTNYDKPHDFTCAINYKFSRRLTGSSTIVYNTGRPITYPVAKYIYHGRELLHYSDRNEYRIPDYFRVDVALNIDANLRTNKWTHSYWSFSVYNLLGRDNVYSIYFRSNSKSQVQGYKLSIFTQPIPSISYNFKF